MKKSIITLVIVAIVGVAGGVYYMFNKPHRSAEGEDPVFKLSAADLFVQFSEKGEWADKQYSNKVLQVEGEINELDKDQAGDVMIILKEEDDIFGVVCTTDSTSKENKEKAESLKLGDYVVLKGICMGFDADVKINKCIILRVGKEEQVVK